MFNMNRLDTATRAHILSLLCEGNSLRATTRIAGVSINTVTKLLIDAGRVSSDYQDRVLRNLPCKRIQVDEIWAFNYWVVGQFEFGATGVMWLDHAVWSPQGHLSGYDPNKRS